MTQSKESKKFKLFLGIAVVVVIVLLAIWAFKPANIPTEYKSPDDVKLAVDAAVGKAIETKDKTIADLQEQLNKQIPVIPTEEIGPIGYLIDELFLNILFVEDTYSDREINLFDGEVDFNGKDYDAEETLILKDIELLANENDFEGNVYMVVPEGAIEYRMNFDSELDTSLIDEEETLVFNFLGSELEISEWDGDSIVFFQGIQYIINEGESITVGDQVITLIFANDDSVHISVDGDSKEINEGQVRTINDLQIKLEYSFETSSFRTGQAKIIVAEDIEKEVIDGEEYKEDSPWNWVIDANSVGIVLNEDFDEIDADGDEEFQAIGSGGSICLPNDYVCVLFNGMSEEDTEEYSFELDERDENWYVRTEGNFLSGLEDYTRIYVNATGIYDRDLELIDSDEVELGDTEIVLARGADWIIIEDFKVNYNLNVSEANGEVLNDDENYLSEYGIIIVNPEDSAEDNEYLIVVPEEQLEGSISLVM